MRSWGPLLPETTYPFPAHRIAGCVDFLVCIPENGLQQFMRNQNEFIKYLASFRSKNK